jgi:hypothetical protein
MAFVAVAALNFGAIRGMSDIKSAIYGAKTNEEFQASVRMLETITVLKLGALPMANVLAVGLLIGYWRRQSRRFLCGFEVFGATGLALFIAGARLFPDILVMPYLRLVGPFVGPGPYISALEILIAYSACSVMLVLPQVVIAIIGGVLTRNFRVYR